MENTNGLAVKETQKSTQENLTEGGKTGNAPSDEPAGLDTHGSRRNREKGRLLSDFSPARILLADDGSAIGEFASSALVGIGEVETVATGESALHSAKSRLPDLFLLHGLVAGVGGIKILKALREDPLFDLIPVIVLAGLAEEGAKEEGFLAGADEVLVGPLSAQELATKARNHLELYWYRRQVGQENERRLQFALTVANMVAYDWDLETGTLLRSAKTGDAWGWEREKAENFFAQIHPDDKALVEEAKRNILQTGAAHELEYRVITQEGQEKWLLDKAQLVYEAGRLTKLAGVWVDITDRKQAEEILRKRKEQFSNIFNQTSVGIAETDLTGKFVLVNDRYAAMVGRSKEALYQIRMQDISHPEDLPENLQLFKKAVERGQPFQIEKRYLRPDGTEIWVHNHVSLVKDLAGKPRYIVAVSQDYTQQKQAVLALRESEERFRNMADAAPMIIWMSNTQGEVVYFNPAWTRITGREVQQDLQFGWEDIIHPEDVEEVRKVYGKALQLHDSFQLEFRIRRFDQQYRLLISRGSPRLSSSGAFLGFVGISVDITDRKLAEEALRESEERFRTFANNIQNLAWMANPDGWIFWYNQQWYDYTGTSYDEMQGWGWEKVHHPHHIDRVVEFVKEAWGKGETWELTFPLRSHDGQYRWFLTRAYPVKDKAGKVIRWIGTNTDIDDQKRAEAALADKNRELLKTNNDLDNFIYTASHDLKAPIMNVEGLMQALVDELPEQVRHEPALSHVISLINTSILRFRNTINNLTDLTKLQRETEEEETRVDLPVLLEEVRLDLEPLIRKAGARVEVDFSQCPVVQFSRKNLRSILYNLFSNALKYRSPDREPQVWITSGQEQEFCVLSVGDNGLGFELSQEKKIFSMFKRLHDHVEGSGIGLYIVKKIVENSGGKVAVESQVGIGSTFSIYLPCK